MPRADKKARAQYCKEYTRLHRQDINKKRRERYASDTAFRQKYLERQRTYASRYQERKNQLQRQRSQEQKKQVLAYYSDGVPRCIHCGIDDIDVLTLDHLNGGGNKHRIKHGSHTYRWIIDNDFPEGFQVLCFNCNWKKRLHPNLDKTI